MFGYDETIEVQTRVYPVEAVVMACYTFIDDMYFCVEGKEPDGKVETLMIGIKPKHSSCGKPEFGKFILDFQNALISHSLRLSAAKLNRGVRAQVIGRALESARYEGSVSGS